MPRIVFPARQCQQARSPGSRIRPQDAAVIAAATPLESRDADMC